MKEAGALTWHSQLLGLFLFRLESFFHTCFIHFFYTCVFACFDVFLMIKGIWRKPFMQILRP